MQRIKAATHAGGICAVIMVKVFPDLNRRTRERYIPCYFLIAPLILAIRSGGIILMAWAFATCAAIFFISSDSFGAVATKGQSIPMSLHVNDGIQYVTNPPIA
jgi:hypothetical protein